MQSLFGAAWLVGGDRGGGLCWGWGGRKGGTVDGD